ncbi:MAG: SRPBCC family protein [Nitriliruptoraceae bacterium]|nr:SRPBCC family protein [Nitriliruptoraceae bacterium]
MEFTNEFHVPSDIDTTFATLTDLERVAPCLPGATLEEVDGDEYTGRVKVKVGPIQVSYRGTAKLIEKDAENHTGKIEARGKETRGAGTANADVVAEMHAADDGGTKVIVHTDINISGKPAQFGRGVMADVGAKLIDTFAERLREMIEADEAGGQDDAQGTDANAAGVGEAAASGAEQAATDTPAAPVTQATGPRKIVQDPNREDDALDLMEVAGAATAKRAIPALAALAALIALIVWLRNR